MLIATLLWAGAGAWQAHTKAREVRAVTKGANDYINGVYELLLERLYTNNALQADGMPVPLVPAHFHVR